MSASMTSSRSLSGRQWLTSVGSSDTSSNITALIQAGEGPAFAPPPPTPPRPSGLSPRPFAVHSHSGRLRPDRTRARCVDVAVHAPPRRPCTRTWGGPPPPALPKPLGAQRAVPPGPADQSIAIVGHLAHPTPHI